MAEAVELHTNETETETNRRVLIIDDNPRIHDDFRTILVRESGSLDLLADLEAELFGDSAPRRSPEVCFLVDSAYQGQEGLEMVQQAVAEERPYAAAFVDVRMPPGWDGIETIQHLWKADPHLLVVICTAYSDYSWEETVEILEPNVDFLVLKKPFDSVVVRQLATSLTEHWSRVRRDQVALDTLREQIAEHGRDLERARTLLEQERSARMRIEQILRRAWELEGGEGSEGDLSSLIDRYRELRGDDEGEDLDSLLSSLPPALERTLKAASGGGAARVNPSTDFRADLAVAQAVTDAIDAYRGIAEIRCDYASAGRVPGQSDHLTQALGELINNAVEALRQVEGQRQIVIRTREAEGRLHIEVRDTGPGIPEALRDTLFEPLTGTNGDGQGLAVVKDLIERRLGGVISVAHPDEGGAAFLLRLPLAS